MSIKKQILFILFIFFMIPITVKADTNCTADKQAHLQSYASKINIYYEYDKNSKKYNITITNDYPYHFYILNSNDKLYIKNDGNTTTILNGCIPNKTYIFSVYGSQFTECPNYFMMNKSVYLPPHNDYYNDPLCEGNEEFELCKEFTTIKIDSYEEFKGRVTQYIIDKEKQKPTEEEETPEIKNSLWNRITDFLLKYNLYFLGPIIVSGIMGIVIIEVRKRKSIL